MSSTEKENCAACVSDAPSIVGLYTLPFAYIKKSGGSARSISSVFPSGCMEMSYLPDLRYSVPPEDAMTKACVLDKTAYVSAPSLLTDRKPDVSFICLRVGGVSLSVPSTYAGIASVGIRSSSKIFAARIGAKASKHAGIQSSNAVFASATELIPR